MTKISVPSALTTLASSSRPCLCYAAAQGITLAQAHCSPATPSVQRRHPCGPQLPAEPACRALLARRRARRRRVKHNQRNHKSMDVDPSQEDEAAALPKARGLGAGAALWHDEAANTQKIYVDRQFFASYEDQVQALTDSKTVYIGNLSFYTTEAQIVELCSRTGPVKKVIMGLNRHTKEPCGFCFVEHYSSEAALDTVSRITGLVLDDRPLRAELDFGFRDGRQCAPVSYFIISRR